MDQAVGRATAGPRFTTLLLGLFAGVAVMMAAIGIYGVMARSVARRTREIGVRMALGARGADVLRLVLGQAVLLVGSGLAAGVVLSFAASRTLAGLLFGIGAADPATFAATALLLGAIGILAGSLAARRAVRVDPMVALRYE
jgi:putative ABC transport system permease protein